MSESMVERVAKRLAAVRDKREHPTRIHVCAPRPTPADYEDARAAIEEMRIPSSEMRKAAISELMDPTVREPKAAAWDWGRAHMAAIHAALQDKTTEVGR